MTEPHYQIHEMDAGRYEVLGPDAPMTIKDTCEEATAWVRKMQGDPSAHDED